MNTNLIVMLVLLVTVAAVGAPMASNVGDKGPYGAIAYSKSTGTTAWGTGNTNTEAAETARRMCGKDDCIVYTITHHSCAGLARSLNDKSLLAWSWSQPNHRQAELRAMSRCEKKGGSCKILGAYCATR
jgi:hypothetical protein